MDDIARIVFAIAVLGHGVAHLAATFNLGRQAAGAPKPDVPEVRIVALDDRPAALSALVALVLWVPATIGFIVAVPAMMDLLWGDLPWSTMLVAAALISIVGVALAGFRWPGGEQRLRPLHVFLALGMDVIILVTQLLLSWPEA